VGFGDFFWYLLWIFYFTVYIFMVFLIISDLFRDHKLNGLVEGGVDHLPDLRAVPDRSGLRHRPRARHGRAQRRRARGRRARGGRLPPLRSSTPAAGHRTGEALLDAGTITQGEYDALKSKALETSTSGLIR
jgi:hypothetical protein